MNELISYTYVFYRTIFLWKCFENNHIFCFVIHTASSHLHPLQVENRLVVDEDNNGKFRLERVDVLASWRHPRPHKNLELNCIEGQFEEHHQTYPVEGGGVLPRVQRAAAMRAETEILTRESPPRAARMTFENADPARRDNQIIEDVSQAALRVTYPFNIGTSSETVDGPAKWTPVSSL